MDGHNTSMQIVDEYNNEVQEVGKSYLPSQELIAEMQAVQAECEEIQSYEITDPESYKKAASDLQLIKKHQKRYEDARKATVAPINEIKSRVQDIFNPVKAVLAKAEQVIKASIVDYDREQKRKAEEEQRRVEAEARQKAKELREKAEAEAAAKAKAAEEKRLAAEKEREKGNNDRAKLLDSVARYQERQAKRAEAKAENVAVEVPTVVPEVQIPIAGISKRKKLAFRIKDFSLVPDTFKLLDEKAVRDYLKLHKEKTEIAGIEIYHEEVVSARGG
jgi:hypothetical protein